MTRSAGLAIAGEPGLTRYIREAAGRDAATRRSTSTEIFLWSGSATVITSGWTPRRTFSQGPQTPDALAACYTGAGDALARELAGALGRRRLSAAADVLDGFIRQCGYNVGVGHLVTFWHILIFGIY